MSVIRITRQFRFEAAHALKDYDGPCRNIHGHSYELSVTVSGSPITDPRSPKKGMVMDFGDLKKIVKERVIDIFDHSLILSREHPRDEIRRLSESFSNILVVDYQPTSENLLTDFADRIRPVLPEGVRLQSMKLRETANSYAEWYGDEN